MAIAYVKAGHCRQALIKKIVYVERYAHQRRSEIGRWTLRELDEQAEAIGEFLEEERKSFNPSDLVEPD